MAQLTSFKPLPDTKIDFQFNPLDLDFKAQPYPTYDYLRSQDPVHWSQLAAWTLTRYRDVQRILTHKNCHSLSIPQNLKFKGRYLEKKHQNLDPLVDASQDFLFFIDPPDHSRSRSLVTKVFTKDRIEAIRPYLQTITHHLVDTVQGQGQMDVMRDYAIRLPGLAMCRLFGLPEVDQPQLNQWSAQLFRVFDPLTSIKTCQQMNQVATEFLDYFRAAIAQRRKNPTSDLITALLTIEENGDRLSESEILSLCIMLFIAGEQTSVATIGNGMMALLLNRDQLQQLQRQPQLIHSAVEEIMRYESPTQYVMRIANEPITIDDHHIESGDKIVLCLGAANRDPDQFDQPNRFNITRQNNRHIAFASGIHFCVGAALARLEVPIAAQTLVQRLPNLQLNTETFEWQDNIVLRCLKSLPVIF